MSQDECAAHRSRIGFEVEIIMQGYWQEQIAPQMKAAIMADWADELEDWPVDQIRWGLREWRSENSRRKPNPGDIVAVLKRQRGEQFAATLKALPTPQPEPMRCTEEERRRNLEVVTQLFPTLVKRVPEVKE